MKKLADITIASILALLIVIGGMTRLHHHVHGDETAAVCLCIDEITGDVCNHHHHDGDTGQHAEQSCPLHIDPFNTNEHTSLISAAPATCGNCHCDLCAPIIFQAQSHNATFASWQTPPDESDGADISITRRGPPSSAHRIL